MTRLIQCDHIIPESMVVSAAFDHIFLLETKPQVNVVYRQTTCLSSWRHKTAPLIAGKWSRSKVTATSSVQIQLICLRH